MAALMFVVPDETARILKELDVPEGTPEQNSHITVAYLGDGVSVETISSLIPVLYDVTSETLPFSVSTRHVTTFPAGDDGVPVIAMVESDELHELRNALCAAMDNAGIEYSKKFPVYKPHVTITYAEDTDTEFELDIPEISWPCHELLLWGSDRGNGRLVVKFPLSLPMGRVASAKSLAAYYKAVVKLAAWRSPA